MTPSSALYALFAWQVMLIRPAIATIVAEAELAQVGPQPTGDPASRLPTAETEVRIIAAVGWSVRSELARVIRHNCAGSVFQMVYSLFENLAKSLGLTPGPEIRCGKLIAGEQLSRILWACRNAFAHGDEWRRTGPRHRHAHESFAILTTLGFSDPATTNMYDVLALIGGNSSEAFIQSVLASGKELSDQASSKAMMPTLQTKQAEGIVTAAIGLLALAITSHYRSMKLSEDGIPSILALQHGSGESAVTIPVAEGNVYNLSTTAEALRNGSINRLSFSAARPYREFDARLQAWHANLGVLLSMNVEDPAYNQHLVALCTNAEALFATLQTLPDPFNLLQSERGVDSKEQAQALMAEVYTDIGLKPLPYREVAVDVINHKSSDRTNRQTVESG